MSQETRVHESAVVEHGVKIGSATAIWDHAHIRSGAKIGRSCIVGEKTHIAYDVEVGDFVKINANVYICAQVTIEDFVMVSAHVVFTNDVHPRAGNIALTGLETSAITAETLSTRVGRGATIGANATIGPGLTLGSYCMIGMGAVVTRDVPEHTVVVGNPARHAGYVCCCGEPLFADDLQSERCTRCDRSFRMEDGAPCLIDNPHAR